MCNGGCEPGDYLNNSWGAQACCLRLSFCVDYIADELEKGREEAGENGGRQVGGRRRLDGRKGRLLRS